MKLEYSFFNRECTDVARDLVGKILAVRHENKIIKLRITETEAYCGESDTACHAHKGKTNRTEVMYRKAGTIYVYLCYGIHWLLNIVTGAEDDPQAVLIRACEGKEGPAKLTKALGITGEYNRKDITCCDTIWIEDDGSEFSVRTDKRVGIAYAEKEDRDRLWRFIMDK